MRFKCVYRFVEVFNLHTSFAKSCLIKLFIQICLGRDLNDVQKHFTGQRNSTGDKVIALF